MTRKTLGWGAVLVVLAIAFGMVALRPRTEAQQPAPAAAAGHRYTVVDTDASNLIVVDNGSNMLYFYAEDPGKEIGEELHLRGSVDLSEVGKPVIRPRAAK